MICISVCVTPTPEGSKLKKKIMNKELDRKISYVEKHCIMNNSLHCKKKWMEIKKLHKMEEELSTKINPVLTKQFFKQY